MDICPKAKKVEFHGKLKVCREKSHPSVDTIVINGWGTIQTLAITLGNKI